MKSTQEIQTFRGQDKKNLYKKLSELERKLTELRLGQNLRKLKNYHEITQTRKSIARLWTILREKIQDEQKEEVQ